MKNTKPRQLVEQSLRASATALSQPELQQILAGKCDRVTIYRVLERLEQEGVIHRIMNKDGVMKYATCQSACTQGHHLDSHVHFSCQKCNEVVCLDQPVPSLSTPEGFIIHQVNVLIEGLCPKCRV